MGAQKGIYIPPQGFRLLPGVWAAAWACTSPSEPCPCCASAGGDCCHGTAKAARSKEHWSGHLLSPKHWERARLTCESPSQGHLRSWTPWHPTWFSCPWLCNGWMESGGEETSCSSHKEDKALCCAHLPGANWGEQSHLSPVLDLRWTNREGRWCQNTSTARMRGSPWCTGLFNVRHRLRIFSARHWAKDEVIL